jgi:UDP-glucose 4-epimerase
VRTLITGGAGFIGSTLAARLVNEGNEVVVLDDLSTGSEENLLPARGEMLTFIKGSILDTEALGKAAVGCERVFHLAAAVGVDNIIQRPLESLHTNLQGTENVLDVCVETGALVLIASTSEIYGKNDSDSLDEESDRIYGSPLKSRWSYAEAKSLDELVTSIYVADRGLEAVIVRPFNTVGPRQTGRYGMVVPRLVGQAVRNEAITVYGDGKQSRCFLHVNDLIEGMLRLLDEPLAIGRPVNLGGPTEITINDLAHRIIELSGSMSSLEHVPYSQAYTKGYEDMRRRVPNTTRARELVDWHPTFTLDQIITSVIEFERTRLTA